MVMGNNDTDSRNYQSVPGGKFFQQTAALWSELIVNAEARAAMRLTFSAGGYYAINVPHHPELRLIVLNSVLFSKKSLGSAAARAADAQLDWLHQQLQQAKNQHQKILIALHIPPGLDVYATRHLHLFTLMEFWRTTYLTRFKSELAAFYPQIISIFSGHLHYDWTQTLDVGNHLDVPVIMVPSVSPVYGSDPAFKIYHYSAANGRVDDTYTYSYPVKGIGTWRIEHVYNLLTR